jgi:hypothetical protein
MTSASAQPEPTRCSPLHCSDEPSERQVRQAIATVIAAYGVRGCAARSGWLLACPG